MSSILQPLFFLLAKATNHELARQLQFLRLENQLLRKKLPKRVSVTASERRLLIKLG